MKKNFTTFLILFIFFLMLALPSVTKQAANEGLQLWIFTVLPALLPYTVISSILMELNGFAAPCRFFSRILKIKLPENKIFIVICGCLCGCPIGAKIAADSYKMKKIKKKTAEFLMCSFNNISPSFLINYVFLEIYGAFISLTLIDKLTLYIIMVISPIIGASIVSYVHNRFSNTLVHSGQIVDYKNATHTNPIITSKNNSLINSKTHTNLATKSTFSKSTFMSMLDKCILSTFEIQVKIGGYIILFNIINKIFLYTLDLDLLQGSIWGSALELTSGLGLFLHITVDNYMQGYIIIPAFITAVTTFGGLCTIFQTKTVIADTDLSISKYALSKILACFISYILTFIFFYIK